MVLSANSEEMIGKEFIVNKELEDLMPKMSDEQFKEFKANIKSVGIKQPIEVLPDKTIVEGHHRYRACMELGIPYYKIPFTVLPSQCVQAALEYAENVNRNRRHLNAYQKGTSALKAYGGSYPDRDIATKIGMNNGDLSKIKKLNKMLSLVRTKVPEKATDYEKRLNLGLIGFGSALKELESAENIDNIIAVIDSKEKLYYKTTKDKVNKSRMTPEQVKAFKAEMEEKYATSKFSKDKKVLEQLNTDIAKLTDPDLYEKVEKGYHEYVQPLIAKIYTAEDKFSNDITIFNVTAEEGYLDAINYLKSLMGTGKLMGMIGFFNLPKEMVRD
jgi:hypothetical protein